MTIDSLPPPTGRKLGALPLQRDPRDLRLARYLIGSLPTPPSRLAWDRDVVFPMLLNDRIGDCVIAGMLHQQQVWAHGANRPQSMPTDQQALSLYERITGYTPRDPSTDRGTDPRAALRFWRQNGAGGHPVLAYTAVDPHDHVMVKTAAHLFGGLGVCLDLPKYAAQMDGHWRLKAAGADAEPGSWGGHWVVATGYDSYGVRIVTWGQVWAMTWGFTDRYCSGLFAAISPDWMKASGQSPTGLDLRTLQSDLAQL